MAPFEGRCGTLWYGARAPQTTLVAAHRTDLHRRLGVAGAVLAGTLIIMGTATAIIRVRGGSAPIPGVSGLAFLAVPLFGLSDLFIVAMPVYDVATRRRPHPATVWGRGTRSGARPPPPDLPAPPWPAWLRRLGGR